MMSNIKFIDQNKTILDAAKLMAKSDIGAVVCKESDGTLAGIFTERDLLKKVVALGVDLNEPIASVMTRNLVTAQLHDELDKIPGLMVRGGFRHVPIMDGFDLVGILSIKDLLKNFLNAKK